MPCRAAVLGRCASSGVYTQGESFTQDARQCVHSGYGFMATLPHHMENDRTLRGLLEQCLQAW